MSGAFLEVLQVLLLVGVQVFGEHLLDVGVLEKHLNALDLSWINVNTLFKLSSLFLQLNDLGGKTRMLNGLLQKVVVGDEDGELGLTDLVRPLLDILGVKSTVIVDKVLKSESWKANWESFISLSV